MKWGRQEELLRQIERDTGTTPKALIDRPELARPNWPDLAAFDLLDSSRLVNQVGPQPLQVSEVLAYLELAGVEDVEDRVLFLHRMKVMDTILLNHHRESQKT